MIALSNPEKIALLTDSTADLPAPMREGKPIYVVPLKIRCEDGEYSDGVDITAEGVYERLHRGELPRTSLPEGGVVSDTLDQIRADGYERVIAVMLSSGLSGTYNMVRLQAGQRDDLEIAVFDSRSGSLGIGIMVLQLWEEILSGASWDTLVRERAPHLVANTFPFFSVDTLEYLRRGGRIGRITALAGTMLSIKPIITFSDDGQLQSIAKVRGRRQVQDKILELLRARFQSGRRYNLAVANGGAPEEMAEFAARLKAEFPNYEHFWEGVMDATLSVYIGDGGAGGAVVRRLVAVQAAAVAQPVGEEGAVARVFDELPGRPVDVLHRDAGADDGFGRQIGGLDGLIYPPALVAHRAEKHRAGHVAPVAPDGDENV